MSTGYRDYVSSVLSVVHADWAQCLQWSKEHPLRVAAYKKLNLPPIRVLDTWRVCHSTALNIFSLFRESRDAVRSSAPRPITQIHWQEQWQDFNDLLYGSLPAGRGRAILCRILLDQAEGSQFLHDFVIERTPNNQFQLYQSYFPVYTAHDFLNTEGRVRINIDRYLDNLTQLLACKQFTEKTAQHWSAAFSIPVQDSLRLAEKIKGAHFELKMIFTSLVYATQEIPPAYQRKKIDISEIQREQNRYTVQVVYKNLQLILVAGAMIVMFFHLLVKKSERANP